MIKRLEMDHFLAQFDPSIHGAIKGALQRYPDATALGPSLATTIPADDVLVGNVGSVFTGHDLRQAEDAYHSYVRVSQTSNGRAAGESVTFFTDGEITRSYVPPTEGEVMDAVNRCETDA